MNSEFEVLARRLTQLERQNRTLRGFAIAAVVIGCASFLLNRPTELNAQVGDGKTVTAEKFVLVNAEGKEEAVLHQGKLVFPDADGKGKCTVWTDGIAIDENGRSLLMIYAHDESGVILMRNGTKPVVRLSANNNGGGMVLHDGQGKRRGSIWTYDNAEAKLLLYNSEGKEVVAVGAGKSFPWTILSHPDDPTDNLYLGPGGALIFQDGKAVKELAVD